jgi:hypothetical protein
MPGKLGTAIAVVVGLRDALDVVRANYPLAIRSARGSLSRTAWRPQK